MKKIFTLLTLTLLFLSCIGKHKSEAQTATIKEHPVVSKDKIGDTVKVDLFQSKIHWKGTKMSGAGKHEGEIKLESAYFITENDQLKGGNFVIDMQTIGVSDIPEHEPIPRRRLNNHLKSSDFFDVEKYPTASFEITNIKKLTTDSLKVSGNLTLKGITKNIGFSALNKDKVFSAKFTFDRFQWNIAYEGIWADKTFVDKDIELKIELKTE